MGFPAAKASTTPAGTIPHHRNTSAPLVHPRSTGISPSATPVPTHPGRRLRRPKRTSGRPVSDDRNAYTEAKSAFIEQVLAGHLPPRRALGPATIHDQRPTTDNHGQLGHGVRPLRRHRPVHGRDSVATVLPCASTATNKAEVRRPGPGQRRRSVRRPSWAGPSSPGWCGHERILGLLGDHHPGETGGADPDVRRVPHHLGR